MSLVWMLNSARERVWLAADYFAPNATLLTAQPPAQERGGDVRKTAAGVAEHTNAQQSRRT